MNKEFIQYTEALELKELGFDEPCLAYWNIDPQLKNPTFNMVKPFEHEWCLPSPMFSQAFRFFREKNYDVAFRKMDYGNDSVFTGYYYTIYKGMEMIDLHGADKRSKTYEEAELACLRKLIEIVKEKL